MLRIATLRSDDHNVAAIIHIHQWRGAPGPTLGAHMVEQQHVREPRHAMTDGAVREAVDPGVAAHQTAQYRPRAIRELEGVHATILTLLQ